MITKSKPNKFTGSTETKRLEGVIVETIYRGHVTAAMGIELAGKLSRILDETPRVDWLVVLDKDCTMEFTGPDFVRSVVRMFKGHNRIAAVIPEGLAGMVARPLAFATGGHIMFFKTREEALVHLRGK